MDSLRGSKIYGTYSFNRKICNFFEERDYQYTYYELFYIFIKSVKYILDSLYKLDPLKVQRSFDVRVNLFSLSP